MQSIFLRSIIYREKCKYDNNMLSLTKNGKYIEDFNNYFVIFPTVCIKLNFITAY